MMKWCIPIEVQSQGGVFTFIANLISYFRKNDIPFCQDIKEDYQLLFVNSWLVSRKDIFRVKATRPELRVLHRVDGSAWDYGRRDGADTLQARVNLLADVTVFQSAYGRYATTRRNALIRKDGPIIYNPVNTDLFNPAGERLELKGAVRLAFVTFSLNRRKGSGELYRIARKNPHVDFYLVGRFQNPPKERNVHLIGHVSDRAVLARTLRSCHALLFLSENETCPNVVLEGLASGLPVLFKDSGGTSEIVGKQGVPVTEESFSEILEEVMRNHEDFSDRARQWAVSRYSPEIIIPRYLEVATQTVRCPLPTLGARLRNEMEMLTLGVKQRLGSVISKG